MKRLFIGVFIGVSFAVSVQAIANLQGSVLGFSNGMAVSGALSPKQEEYTNKDTALREVRALQQYLGVDCTKKSTCIKRK
jgi:flagellar biosynthesis protein FliR